MSRLARFFSSLALFTVVGSAIIGYAGCSSEPPPIAAINPAAATESNSAEAESDATGPSSTNGASADSVSEKDDPGARPGERDTPDAAVLRVLRGLSANQPDAMWDALPESYRRDVNDLASRFAARLHPEAWRWFSQIVRKSAGLLSVDALDGSRRETALRIWEWLASGTPADLERVQHADLGDLLRTRGRHVMADARTLLADVWDIPEFSAALRDIAGPLPEVFHDPSLLKMNIKALDGESSTLEIQLPTQDAILADLYRFDMEFACVEGKWVPRWLADRWPGWIAAARERLDEILPSEQPQENFGIVFRYLAQLDAMVEVELARARGDQTVEPTLFDVVDFVLGFAEDLGLPVPAEFWGEDDFPRDGMPIESGGELDRDTKRDVPE